MTPLAKTLLILALPFILASATAPATQPAAASLSGVILSKARITRVAAVDREWADVLKTSEPNPKDLFLYEGTVNDQGEYRIDKLIAGRTYDLIVWTTAADGTVTRWEGATMDYHRPVTPSTAATDADRKAIESLIKDPAQFYDKVRPLRIAADHQHATVLVELVRTREFVAGAGGEIIYRVELWYFENLFGGWAKDNNSERVLARIRGKPADLPKNWQFLPQLGGLQATLPVTATPASQPQAIQLPDTPDPRRGISGGFQP
jgi:hypothetical protein